MSRLLHNKYENTEVDAPQNSGDFLSLANIEELALIPAIKKRGEHFSHFNPRIVRWGYVNMVPNPKDSFLGGTYKIIFKRIFSRFFRLLTESYLYIHRTKNLKKEQAAYIKAIEANNNFNGLKYLSQRYKGVLKKYKVYNIAQDDFPFTAQMAIGFWLRRGIDGTGPELWRGLKKVMVLYDKNWVVKKL